MKAAFSRRRHSYLLSHNRKISKNNLYHYLYNGFDGIVLRFDQITFRVRDVVENYNESIRK